MTKFVSDRSPPSLKTPAPTKVEVLEPPQDCSAKVSK